MDTSDLETYLKTQESDFKSLLSLANTDDLTHMELSRVLLQHHARMGAIATNALQALKSASASVSLSSSNPKCLPKLPSCPDEMNLDSASAPPKATNSNLSASSSPPRRSKRGEPVQSVFSRTYRPIAALTKRDKTPPKPSTSTSSSTVQSIKKPVLRSSKSKHTGLLDSDQFSSPSTPVPKSTFNLASKATTIPTPPSTNSKRPNPFSFASDEDEDEPPSPTPQPKRRYNTGSANPNHGARLYVPALNTSSSKYDVFTANRRGVRGELGGASRLFGGARVRSISGGGNKKTGEKGGVIDLISGSDSDDNEAEEDRRTEREIEAKELRGGVGRGKDKGKGREMSASAKGIGELDDGEDDDLEPVKKKVWKEYEFSDSDDDDDNSWLKKLTSALAKKRMASEDF